MNAYLKREGLNRFSLDQDSHGVEGSTGHPLCGLDLAHTQLLECFDYGVLEQDRPFLIEAIYESCRDFPRRGQGSPLLHKLDVMEEFLTEVSQFGEKLNVFMGSLRDCGVRNIVRERDQIASENGSPIRQWLGRR